MEHAILTTIARTITHSLAAGRPEDMVLAAARTRELADHVGALRSRTRESLFGRWSDHDQATRFALIMDSDLPMRQILALADEAAWPRLVRASGGRPYTVSAAIGALDHPLSQLDSPLERLAEEVEGTSRRAGRSQRKRFFRS